MRLLALERPVDGVADEDFSPALLADEAQRVYELQQLDVLREIHFRADRHEAVLTLECGSVAEAEAALATLPLVRSGLIAFDLVPLAPYPGLARLFRPRG